MFVQKKIFRKRKSCGVSKEVGYIFLDRDCTLTGTKSIFGKKNIKKMAILSSNGQLSIYK